LPYQHGGVMMAPRVSNDPVNPTFPGTVLAGKYRVERILGQGGMGVVVEARHIALDERVALKFLLPEYAKVNEAAARFLREARNAVKIKSEHVARVSDVGTLESGAPYMVMEYLEGRDLSGVLEKTGVLSILDACDYIIQGCEAIAEAHSYGIVHRDLKPANLFLSKRPDGTGIVKVLDFGISKSSGGVDNLTKTTAAMGSALYMSPEQMQQTRSVDHRTDIYALGISLYELLAGKQPFYADTLPQLCAEILTGIPTPIRTLRPDVPEALAVVMARAYARDRGQRFQSIAEFVIALAPYAPARAQQTVERVARIGGFHVPEAQGTASGSSGVFAAPVAPPSGVFAAPQAAPAGGTPQLPDPTAGIGAPPAQPPTQPGPPPGPQWQQAGHQIVPGPYSAPMSVRAAASFAQGTAPGIAMTGQPAGSKAASFLLIAVAMLGVLGIGVAIALRYGPGRGPAVAGSGTATTTSVAAPAVSSVLPAASSAPSVDVKPPDPAKTAEPAVPTASVLPAVDRPSGTLRKPLPVPKAPAAPAARPGLGELPDSVYDGKKK
jgi:serine/threonine-protein kinase